MLFATFSAAMPLSFSLKLTSFQINFREKGGEGGESGGVGKIKLERGEGGGWGRGGGTLG